MKTIIAAFCFFIMISAQTIYAAENSDIAAKNKRPCATAMSDKLRKSVIYQIHVPLFTSEGTLAKAAEMLGHIKSAGINTVYLSPVVSYDDDPDQNFWSKRQRESGMNNPKNPYRMKDYFNIDPQIGTDADLKNFVEEAHGLGMKVVLDLVYFHCGPKAVFIGDNPDFIVRNPDGSPKVGPWFFPQLNFGNPKLREYLFKNMEYFVEKFDIDGYRMDVSPSVPLDFWVEANKRVSKLKPDLLMIAEGESSKEQLEAFNANYSFTWQRAVISVFSGKEGAGKLAEVWKAQNAKFPSGARLLRNLDTHDVASDSCLPRNGGVRYEKAFGHAAMDAIFVLNFSLDGIPLVFMGNEFADDAFFSMFSDKHHGRTFIAWENAVTNAGRRRMKLLGELSEIRQSEKALWKGNTQWLKSDDEASVAAFLRQADGKKILVAVNARNNPADARIFTNAKKLKPLMMEKSSAKPVDDGIKASFEPYGWFIMELQ